MPFYLIICVFTLDPWKNVPNQHAGSQVILSDEPSNAFLKRLIVHIIPIFVNVQFVHVARIIFEQYKRYNNVK